MIRTGASLAVLLLGAAVAQAQPTPAPPAPRWFKGNTHAHARILVPIPHGDSSPKRLARWYERHGYQFLVLSDHNRVGREERARKVQTPSFILIPGIEVTSDTRTRLIYKLRHKNAPERVVHSTGVGIDPDRFDTDIAQAFGPGHSVVDILKQHDAETRRSGGFSILNHPNFRDPITAPEIVRSGMPMFEVYNAYPHAKNFGSGRHASTEQLWDQVLSLGHKLYGVASDDAHHTKRWNRKLKQELGIHAPAGGGWVMVRARRLTQAGIVSAMRAGEFYASSGVHLLTLKVDRAAGTFEVGVDLTQTQVETTKEHVYAPARAVPATTTRVGPRITFITKNGQVLKTVDGPRATVDLATGDTYIRARVSVIAATQGGKKEFFAWTQPVFLNASATASGGAAGALGGGNP